MPRCHPANSRAPTQHPQILKQYPIHPQNYTKHVSVFFFKKTDPFRPPSPAEEVKVKLLVHVGVAEVEVVPEPVGVGLPVAEGVVDLLPVYRTLCRMH